METLRAEDRNLALWTIGQIAVLRGLDKREDEVATHFGYRGEGQMRQQLEEWGMPGWFIQNDAPPKPKKSSDAGEAPPRIGRRQFVYVAVVGEAAPLGADHGTDGPCV